KYGAKLGRNYVLDSECYISRQRGAGETPLYFVPIIGKNGMNRKSAVSRNLSSVLFLKAGEVGISLGDDSKGERTAAALVTSSPESWLMSDRISLMPFAMAKPGKDKLAKRDLAVLIEGRFKSAFDAAPAQAAQGAGTQAELNADTRLPKSVQSGKLIVVGTSEIAGPSLIDPEGKQPVAVFVRNALDYLSGNQELNDMRTKGLGLDPLNKTAPALRTAAKSLNIYGLPLLIVLAGLIAWKRRTVRRTKIQAFYARSAEKKAED
ncbi:MAG: ABC transporter, partial [Treponemataceae bacterium]